MSTQIKNVVGGKGYSIFKSVHFFYKKFIEPKSKNEDLKRREFILNIFLLSLIILSGIELLIELYQSITFVEYRGISPIICFSIFLVFLILYIISRKGFFFVSSYIFIVIFFISTTYAIYRWGVDVPAGLLFYVLIIIMSGVLISTLFAFIITIISSLSIITAAYLQINNIIFPNLYWKAEPFKITDTFVVSIIFGIIVIVSWLSNREIEKSLKRARKSEAELKEERDLLEVKVEERTQELKKTELEKMLQLYRFAEFGRLSGGLFHDLINPLSAVSLNIEQVIKDNQEHNIVEAKTHLAKAIRATQRMQNFILAIRKQMASQENKAEFSLVEEINQVIEVLAYKARKANVKINFLATEDIKIYGDSIKFSQIITNLITNAIDAYPETDSPRFDQLEAAKQSSNPYPVNFSNRQEREVNVGLNEKDGIINLKFEDWGCGIPKEILNKIFDPFFTNKDFKKGIGIGLSLTKRIIEKDFQGTIKVESEAGKGTKFMVKFPKNMATKMNKTINNYLYYLIDEQQADGSFLAATSSKSVLLTAFILSCLNNLNKIEQIKNIKQKAVDFLLSQKNENWLFSENIGINFYILSVLAEYDPKVIDGIVMAKILMTLTSVESKEGGPYYSDINKQDKDIDLWTNSNIAYFLSLQNVDLPELNKLIESAIDSGNFKSSFLKSIYPVIYIISKFYNGEKRQKLIDFILSKKNEVERWSNPLNNILAISALINLNYPIQNLRAEINYLKNCETEELHKSYPFYITDREAINHLSTAALNIAFYLETLDKINKVDKQPQEVTKREILFDDDEKRMMDMIIKVAEQRFSVLNGEIKDFALQEIQKTIKGNTNKHMSLVAYYFKKALGKNGERISDDMVAKMNLANLFFWTAFIIYDNFWDEDEEADPRVLPTANLYARNFTRFFNVILSPKTGFNQFFRKLMDKLDAANTWETIYCRTKVKGSKFTIPEILPNHGNYERKYEPCAGHVLGPVAMLVHLGYNLNSPEVQNLIQYFRNYLIAIQINDDAHDWEEDLRRGHLSTVVIMLLQDYLEKYPDKKEIDIDKELSELQKIFWFKTIIKASEIAVWHTDKSREVLQAMTVLEDITPLEKIIIITENVAKQALEEQKKTVDFLRTYKD